ALVVAPVGDPVAVLDQALLGVDERFAHAAVGGDARRVLGHLRRADLVGDVAAVDRDLVADLDRDLFGDLGWGGRGAPRGERGGGGGGGGGGATAGYTARVPR